MLYDIIYLLDIVHIRKQKLVELAQRCTEFYTLYKKLSNTDLLE